MLTLLTLVLLLDGCQQRQCLDKDAYNGIYNALTCDYEGRIEELEGNMSQYKSKDDEEQEAYQKLLTQVDQKEKEVENYRTNIQELDTLMNEIDHSLDNIKTNQAIEPLLYEIRNRVIYMKRKLNKERK